MKRYNYECMAILPCKRNSKIPATPHGLLDASFGVNITELTNKGYNIAVACAKSGLIALDLDYHKNDSNAEEEIKELEVQLNSVLPRTLTQTTASGKGKHLIFSSRGIVNPRGQLSKNVDIRFNAYIMFAPSVINGRQYQIVDGVDENGVFIIAELPQPWVDYINHGSTSKHKKQNHQGKQQVGTHKANLILDVGSMFDKCAFLAHCRDNAAILSEPEWFSMVSVLAPINDSDGLIHQLSQPYSGYSYEETQRKIDNARTFGLGHSCSYISGCFPDICSGCPFLKGGM